MATVKEINALRASRVAQGLDPYTGTPGGGAEAKAAERERIGGTSGVSQMGLSAPEGVTLDTTPAKVKSEKTTGTSSTTPSVASPGLTDPNAPTALTPSPTTQPPPAIQPSNTSATPEQVQQVAEATRQVNDLASRYKQGLAVAKAQTPTAPPTLGQASNTIQATLPGAQEESPSVWPVVFQGAPEIQTGFMDFDKWMSPPEQKKTLLQEYQEMSKALGLDSLNQDLINEKAIIEGEEDAIRNEITASGGVATDNQVQAIANARNKTRIKNYNKLIDLKTATMQQLDTMMDLSVQDRKMAEDEFDRKLNYAFRIQEFVQKSVSDAKNMYLSLGEKMGWDTLFSSTSTYDQGLIQKTLGISSQQMQQLVSQSQQSRAIALEEKNLDNQYKKAQIANTYSQINERSNVANSYGTIDGKPQNQSQSAANSYANRLNEADVVIANLGSKFTGTLSMLPNFNFMKSGDRQAYEQAQNNFVTAVLRRESGASIAPTEFETARKTYFPQPGDKPEVLAQKETARNTVINNFYREANVNRPVLPGQVIKSGGKKYRVGLDGVTLEEI